MGYVTQRDEPSEKRRLRMEPCGHPNLYGEEHVGELGGIRSAGCLVGWFRA